MTRTGGRNQRDERRASIQRAASRRIRALTRSGDPRVTQQLCASVWAWSMASSAWASSTPCASIERAMNAWIPHGRLMPLSGWSSRVCQSTRRVSRSLRKASSGGCDQVGQRVERRELDECSVLDRVGLGRDQPRLKLAARLGVSRSLFNERRPQARIRVVIEARCVRPHAERPREQAHGARAASPELVTECAHIRGFLVVVFAERDRVEHGTAERVEVRRPFGGGADLVRAGIVGMEGS